MRASIAIWFAVAVMATACGRAGDPTDTVSGSPMIPTADTAPVAVVAQAPQGEAPRVESVRLVPTNPIPGETIRADASVWASDDQDIVLDFKWTVGGERLASRGPEVTLYRASKGDSIKVTVVANHRGILSEPYSASTRVANRPPTISRVQISPSSKIEVGADITALPHAKDPDADPMTFRYRWTVNGSRADERGATFATQGLQRGDSIRVEVVASDGEDDSVEFFSREIKLSNSAPIIVSQPGATGEDGVFRYRVVATDADGDSARFSLAQAPEGMTISAVHGDIEWLPTREQHGNHVVEVVVEDVEGARSSQRFEMVVGDSPDPTDAEVPPAAPANN